MPAAAWSLWVTASRDRLFFGSLIAILDSMSSSPRIFAFILGAFLALGMNLSAIRAAEMPIKMTMSSGMSVPGKCHPCGNDGGVDHKKMDACNVGCVTPTLAVVPQTIPTKLIQASIPVPLQHAVLLGRLPSPDPLPPRSSDLS